MTRISRSVLRTSSIKSYRVITSRIAPRTNCAIRCSALSIVRNRWTTTVGSVTRHTAQGIISTFLSSRVGRSGRAKSGVSPQNWRVRGAFALPEGTAF